MLVARATSMGLLGVAGRGTRADMHCADVVFEEVASPITCGSRRWQRASNAEQQIHWSVCGWPAHQYTICWQALKTRDLPRWINFPDFERVDWLNALLGRLWPHVTAAATSLVHELLDPQLKVNKPRWIADISLTECAAPGW